MIRVSFLVLLFGLPGLAQAQTPTGYEAMIGAHRDSLHAAFLDPERSPMQPAEIAAFPGLDYYAVDPAYRVRARFERAGGDEPVKMNTSGGDIRDYRRFGTLHFELGGAPVTLAAYQSVIPHEDPAYADYLAVPFKDATSGETTYAAGRYLDLRIPDIGGAEGDEVVLDFNKAYAPYCAYSADYSCILPPRENHLDVAVEAGVKEYEVWDVIVSDEGGYSVAFPGMPLDRTEPTAGGRELLRMKALDRGDEAFVVMYSAVDVDFDTLSAAELTTVFDVVQQTGVQNYGGTADHVQDIELDGVPGRRFEVDASDSPLFGRWHMFGSGSTLYQVAVMADGRRPTGPDVERFMNSFRLLEGGATPRLQRLMEEAGYAYSVDDDGDYRLLFSTTDERTHLVWVSTHAPHTTLVPSYEVWALVGRGMRELPTGLAEALLRRSGDLPTLSAQLYGGEDGEGLAVALSVVIEQDVPVETLQRVAELVAVEADELEARFVGTDDL